MYPGPEVCQVRMRKREGLARQRMILQVSCAAVLAACAAGGWGLRQASTRAKALERGNRLVSSGQYAEAVLALSEAIRLNSNPAKVHELRAIAYPKLRDHKR